MQTPKMRIVIFGLSITSSWGNGHATTYRSLVRGLVELGHDVLFLERDQPWYAENRDLPKPPYGRTILYSSLAEMKDRFAREVRQADVTIVGSYVPNAVQIGEWVLLTANGITAFYDIDTPVTLGKLERGDTEYLTRGLIMRYDLYLSFTGGATLLRLERKYKTPRARVLYCSVDTTSYYREKKAKQWDLGYLGTYSADRQPAMEKLLLEPAASAPEYRFIVAGPMFPQEIEWPPNVHRVEHLPPANHRGFYNAQKFTLNLTRQDMVRAGYSPSVRLFEAAACGTPIISDYWNGLEDVFEPGREVLVARTGNDTLRYLRNTTEEQRAILGERLRKRVLAEHTCEHRARQLESYALEILEPKIMQPTHATEAARPLARTRAR
jgi:spore maturation protein CgeB